jgi:hypothetical protein
MAVGKRHAIQLDLKQTVDSESPLTLKPLPPAERAFLSALDSGGIFRQEKAWRPTVLPNLNRQSKFDVQSVFDLTTDQIDQSQKVRAAGTRLGNKIITVAIEDFNVSDLGSL